MALVNTEIIHQSDHGHKIKLVFRMTYTNGEQVTLHRHCPTVSDIPALQAATEASAAEQIKKKTAASLARDGADIAASGEASANDVAKYYLYKALHEPDLIKAFKVFAKIRAYVLAQGYTWEQVRTFSGMRDKDWLSLKARIDYFADNRTAITNFIAVAEGDPGAI